MCAPREGRRPSQLRTGEGVTRRKLLTRLTDDAHKSREAVIDPLCEEAVPLRGVVTRIDPETVARA